jgi:hypothetical protein
MATTKSDTTEAEQQIRELAANLRAHRERPCLLFVSRNLVHADVATVRAALEDETGEHLDVIVGSPGGDVEAAYLVARELRRRFEQLTVFVPFQAKSAATVLCLAADELVLGSLGELGPLEQQYAYPTHGFVIDREEAEELSLPTRVPDDQEVTLLDRLALALIKFGIEQDLIALAGRPTSTSAVGRAVIDRTQEKRRVVVPRRIRRQRSGGVPIPSRG